MFEIKHRVGVSNRRAQQTFGVVGRRGRDNFDAGKMRESGFDGLRMINRAVYAAAVGRANHERTRPIAVRAITQFRRFAHNLVKSGMNEIGKFDFRYRTQADACRANRHANNREFRNRRINYAFRAKLVIQAIGRAKDAAQHADIFAEKENAFVARHF